MAPPALFIAQGIAGQALRITFINGGQIRPLIRAVDKGIAHGPVRQRPQGFQGHRFLPLMTIEFIAIRLIETGLAGHEDVNVMAAALHFL